MNSKIRFHFCFASLFVVGIGSWMFHMTLQYEMQTLDTLPMVRGGLKILYCMCVVQSRKENEKLASYMTTIASIFRFHLCFASLFVVGIGSWMFHMTLQYEMQMLDELPMVWGGLTILYCMCVVQSRKEDKKLACYMTSIASIFTIAHLYLKIPMLLFVSKAGPGNSTLFGKPKKFSIARLFTH